MRSDRLLELAAHLETGKLGHKRFQARMFSNIFSEGERDDSQECGAIGSTLGECPYLWPNHWEFVQDRTIKSSYTVRLRDKAMRGENAYYDAERFFETATNETLALFDDANQSLYAIVSEEVECVLQTISGIIGPKQIASRIRELVKWREEQVADE